MWVRGRTVHVDWGHEFVFVLVQEGVSARKAVDQTEDDGFHEPPRHVEEEGAEEVVLGHGEGEEEDGDSGGGLHRVGVPFEP